MKTKLIIASILFLLLVVIIVQNTQVVTLQLFFWKISLSRIVLIALTLSIGFVLGYIVAKLKGTPPQNLEQ